MKEYHFSVLVCILGSATQLSAAEMPADGEMLFMKYCVQCHGAEGKGHAAEELKTRPSDLTGNAARRNGVWPVLDVMSIVDGYPKQTNSARKCR